MHTIKITETFPCNAADAFRLVTADPEPLGKYAPNTASVRLIERIAAPDGTFTYLLEFRGNASIPAIARGLFRPEMLSWRETLHCDPRTLSVTWRIITDHYTEYVTCEGTTTVRDWGAGSRMEITGILHIRPMSITGVPDPIVRGIVTFLEGFIARLAETNISKFFAAVKLYVIEQTRP